MPFFVLYSIIISFHFYISILSFHHLMVSHSGFLQKKTSRSKQMRVARKTLNAASTREASKNVLGHLSKYYSELNSNEIC